MILQVIESNRQSARGVYRRSNLPKTVTGLLRKLPIFIYLVLNHFRAACGFLLSFVELGGSLRYKIVYGLIVICLII